MLVVYVSYTTKGYPFVLFISGNTRNLPYGYFLICHGDSSALPQNDKLKTVSS